MGSQNSPFLGALQDEAKEVVAAAPSYRFLGLLAHTRRGDSVHNLGKLLRKGGDSGGCLLCAHSGSERC